MTPKFYIFYKFRKINGLIFSAFQRGNDYGRRYNSFFTVHKFYFKSRFSFVGVFCQDFRFNLEKCVFIASVKLAVSVNIRNLQARFENQIDVAENTGQSPHILIFQITACAISVNGNRKLIYTLYNVIGNIVFLWIKTIFGVSDIFTVYIDFSCRINPCKTYKNIIVGIINIKFFYI